MSLTKERRAELADEDFAVPSKRKMPIRNTDDDVTHTRLAWDMVDRTQGLTPDDRTGARHRIIRRAHELGIDTKDWHVTAHVAFEAMALEVPQVDSHPNRMPFKGVLTRVDQNSDKPPGGSTGKLTYLPSDVAQAALPSILGMAVDYTPDFDGHDRRNKIGIITAADVVGDAIEIEGFLYAKDFPDECRRIRAEKDALGFSYELDARIQDVDADVWVIAKCVFTGAAILYKEDAAYTSTSLAAQAEGIEIMTKEEMLALFAEATKPLMTKIDEQGAKIDAQGKELSEIKAGKGASLAGPIIDQVKPHVDALNAAADGMEKAGIGTDGKAGHVGIVRRVAAHMAAAAVSGKTPMVFTDHDYLPSARVEASAESAAATAAAKETSETLKKLGETVASIGTQMTDLKAAAFKQVAPPDRATIPPAIMTLLARGGLKAEDAKDGKLTIEQVDKALDAAGVKGTKAIETKLKLRHEGVLAA